MKRRIFVAIEFPDSIRSALNERIREWRWLPIRWLTPEQWHVTVAPPVLLDDAEVRTAIEAISSAELGAPFPVRFERIVLAPPGERARMVWLEGETPTPFTKLRARVTHVLKTSLAIPPQGRDFRFHATLARFAVGELQELERKTPILGEMRVRFTVSSISLMESHLKPSGAEYERIEEIFLS